MRFWLKLGFIGFGGPAGQIAIMQQELVEKRRWISERRFLHALNYCMVLPGPEAQQLAIYLGWPLHRTWGGIVAGMLFVLPSLFTLAGLTYVHLVFGDLSLVRAVFGAIKPAVVAIVVFAAWRIGARALRNRPPWALAAASFIATLGFVGAWTQATFGPDAPDGASAAPLITDKRLKEKLGGLLRHDDRAPTA